jgi:putative transposase
MQTVESLKTEIAVTQLCEAVGLNRSFLYRYKKPPIVLPLTTRAQHPRSLSRDEVRCVEDVLHSERFVDTSPAEVYATLLDEGKYLCSVRTMYRILATKGENLERRRGHKKGSFKRPELLANGPNQVWSWDITKLMGPQKWTYFYLYVMLDIFSRYVIGWFVSDRENGSLAKHFIDECCQKQNIKEEQLTIHSDRGSPMKSKPVAFLMADLGITKSFSRPSVSNDNPFSEAHFKTLKYHPNFPQRFGSIEDSKVFCSSFFPWYNGQHKHSGIEYYTPEDVHYGRAEQYFELRNKTLKSAHIAHPERFVGKHPKAVLPPKEVWINPPKSLENKLNCKTNTLSEVA